jgi:hypothetical protein
MKNLRLINIIVSCVLFIALIVWVALCFFRIFGA